MERTASDARVERMHRGDRGWARFALIVLWATVLFVFYSMAAFTNDNGVLVALAAGAGLVLFFNTISIIVMLSRYSEDKEHIYGLDIHYLDAGKNAVR